MSDYEIVEASPFEWGLVYKGLGCRTWWKSHFEERPTLEHPEIKHAIENNEAFIKEYGERGD